MRRHCGLLLKWGPALVVMSVIFFLSSRTKNSLPNFGSLDFVLKKAGHVLGYGLLALAYWRGLGFGRRQAWYAWLLALAYACTDEFHQSFVAGRHPSLVDVLLFDDLGAAGALLLVAALRRKSPALLTRTPDQSPRLPPTSGDGQSECR